MQKEIRCPQCGTLFGKEISVADDIPMLTIKNRDLYRTCRGGVVFGPCRNCGVTVTWGRKNVDDDT